MRSGNVSPAKSFPKEQQGLAEALIVSLPSRPGEIALVQMPQSGFEYTDVAWDDDTDHEQPARVVRKRSDSEVARATKKAAAQQKKEEEAQEAHSKEQRAKRKQEVDADHEEQIEDLAQALDAIDLGNNDNVEVPQQCHTVQVDEAILLDPATWATSLSTVDARRQAKELLTQRYEKVQNPTVEQIKRIFWDLVELGSSSRNTAATPQFQQAARRCIAKLELMLRASQGVPSHQLKVMESAFEDAKLPQWLQDVEDANCKDAEGHSSRSSESKVTDSAEEPEAGGRGRGQADQPRSAESTAQNF